MFNKFQQLFLQIMENNTAAPGGAFGDANAWSPENQSNNDTRTTMALCGKSAITNKKRRLKKRNLSRTL